MVSSVESEIELGPLLTVRGVAGAHAALSEGLAGADRLVVTIPPDAEMDVLLVQLLESARQHAVRQGKTIALGGTASPRLSALLVRAGFEASMSREQTIFWGVRGQTQ